MAKNKEMKCDCCQNTGLLNAKLVRSEEGDKHISVVICGNHYNNELAEKTMSGMHLASGLDVEVLRAENPENKQG